MQSRQEYETILVILIRRPLPTRLRRLSGSVLKGLGATFNDLEFLKLRCYHFKKSENDY